MNEKFFKLPQEKQRRIINAGLECFGKHEYKHAITDDIANKAEISKGLLFHYFENKRSFYMFLFKYCQDEMLAGIINEDFYQITDFFELIRYGAMKKIEMINKHPFMMEFVLRSYYSLHENISSEINSKMQKAMSTSFETYFSRIDFSPFKEGVDPKQIFKMLVWMSDGYLHEKQRLNEEVSIEVMMIEFNEWEKAFRKMAYKEEF